MFGACVTTAPDGASNGVVPPTDILHPDRPAELSEGTVVSISDGDSLDVEIDGETIEVRLIGINSTERGECFSDDARDFLIDVLTDMAVGVERVGSDQFGRTLTNLWLDDQLINLTLVLEGLALGQTADEANPYAETILDAEEIAYQDELGLWAPDACGGSSDLPPLQIDNEKSNFDPDGPDDEYLDTEVIVLHNTGSEMIDLVGFTLRDESSANRYVFKEPATIAPDGTIEVDSGCGSEFSICAGHAIWNNGGDMVLLLDPLGNVVARLRY